MTRSNPTESVQVSAGGRERRAGVSRAMRRLLKVFGLGPRRVRASRLYLEVTARCNLRCLGCYTGAGAENPGRLSLEEQKSVVRQARQMGARVVSLSGSGEPLLYEHLFPLVDYIRQLGMTVVMFTNGTVLDARKARMLMERDVAVYFQLHSLQPEVLDAMTGTPNTHGWLEYTWPCRQATRTVRLPAGLKHLLDQQFACGKKGLVRLEALITRVNGEGLADVARLSRDLGLALHLETPVFTGRALENHRRLALDASAYRQVYRQLTEVLGTRPLLAHRDHRCAVERNPVVWTDGEVAFCSSRRGGCIGNVRDKPLRELFAEAQRLKREQDRRVRRGTAARYFHTCSSRRYYEMKHGLPAEY